MRPYNFSSDRPRWMDRDRLEAILRRFERFSAKLHGIILADAVRVASVEELTFEETVRPPFSEPDRWHMLLTSPGITPWILRLLGVPEELLPRIVDALSESWGDLLPRDLRIGESSLGTPVLTGVGSTDPWIAADIWVALEATPDLLRIAFPFRSVRAQLAQL